ncbi:MAG TPA: VWA domain-containing protein [Pyrinomonadaceae bacterium]|nr:VWA domain-containing protein [Pyrinomonadaceae bacterium]
MTELFQNDRQLWKRGLVCLALIAILVFVGQAQDRDDVIKIDTDLASFEVTVVDKNGRPVRNLKEDEFRIYEDGVERKIDFFQPLTKNEKDRPLSVVFALDVSGSMTEAEIERLRSGMQSFIARLADYDSYFAVVSFAMNVRTLQSFTNRKEKLEKSFDRLVRDQDGLSTHAYDAVDEAVRLIARKAPKVIRNRIPKRAVIVVSDGFPVGDVVSPRTLIERANDAETSVYSVILPSYSRLQIDKRPVMTPLEASGLIERTGGKSFYATDKSFNALFEALAEEITASYAIAFYPDKGTLSAAKERHVTIRSKSGFVVRQNRTGYEVK